MTKGILIGMLSRLGRLCCGKRTPPTGGASVEKASAGGSTKTDSIMVNSLGMKLAWIPLGTFQMGSNVSDDEKPIHTVKITNGFYMGIYEVTQEQYKAVMGIDPSRFSGDNLPVDSVSWNDAVEFCKKLSQKEGKNYTLPTEAQWEYACRAGTTMKYYFGDKESQLGEYAWYHQNSGGNTHPVGKKKANVWGLYDMLGNVLEWCQDRYVKDWYSKGPVENPLNESYGDMKFCVLRGGGWGTYASHCRFSTRGYSYPDTRDYKNGFRVVLGL